MPTFSRSYTLTDVRGCIPVIIRLAVRGMFRHERPGATNTCITL